MIVVSSCLCGLPCRYDGKDNKIDLLEKLYHEGKIYAVCPEDLGGLPTPRDPAEIVHIDNHRRVITKMKQDVTDEFNLGAQKTLTIALEKQASCAILKANSPSCGCGMIYDGTFSGIKIKGNGITADLLQQNGVEIYNETNFPSQLFDQE